MVSEHSKRRQRKKKEEADRKHAVRRGQGRGEGRDPAEEEAARRVGERAGGRADESNDAASDAAASDVAEGRQKPYDPVAYAPSTEEDEANSDAARARLLMGLRNGATPEKEKSGKEEEVVGAKRKSPAHGPEDGGDGPEGRTGDGGGDREEAGGAGDAGGGAEKKRRQEVDNDAKDLEQKDQTDPPTVGDGREGDAPSSDGKEVEAMETEADAGDQESQNVEMAEGKTEPPIHQGDMVFGTPKPTFAEMVASRPADGAGSNTHGYNTRSKTAAVTLTKAPSPLKMVEKPKEFGDVSVRFHVLVAPDFEFDAEGGDQLFIAFGPPFSDFSEFRVQMERCLRSDYANESNLLYFTGELALTKEFVGKAIPYKYVVRKKKINGDLWEFLYAFPRLNDHNRCMKVPHDCEESDQYDDVVCRENPNNHFNPREDRVDDMREKASRTMLSCLKESFVQTHGPVRAIQAVEKIVRGHNNGLEMMVGYRETGSKLTARYHSYTVLRGFFNRLNRDIIQKVTNKEGPRDDLFGIALFCCLFAHKMGISFDSIKILNCLFRIFKDHYEEIVKTDMLQVLLPAEGQRQVVRQAVTDAVKKFIYLVRNISKSETAAKASWLHAIPLLLSLNQEMPSINVLDWRRSSEGTPVLDELEDMSTYLEAFPQMNGLLVNALNDDEFSIIMQEDCLTDFAQRLGFLHLIQRVLTHYNVTQLSRNPGEAMQVLQSRGFFRARETLFKVTKVSCQGESDEDISSTARTYEDVLKKLGKRDVHCCLIVFLICDALLLLTQIAPRAVDVDSFKVWSDKALASLQKSKFIQSWAVWNEIIKQRRQIVKEKDFLDEILANLVKQMDSTEPFEALECYLDCCQDLDPMASEQLFTRAMETFQTKKKDVFRSAFERVKGYLGGGEKKHAIKMVEQVIMRNFDFSAECADVASITLLMTESDIHRNMLEMVHQVGLEAFKDEVKGLLKVGANQFRSMYSMILEGNVTISEWRVLSEEKRWERLSAIAKTFWEMKLVPECRTVRKKWLRDRTFDIETFCGNRDDLLLYVELLKNEKANAGDVAAVEATLRAHDDKINVSQIQDLNSLVNVTDDDLANVHWIVRWNGRSAIVANLLPLYLQGQEELREAVEEDEDLASDNDNAGEEDEEENVEAENYHHGRQEQLSWLSSLRIISTLRTHINQYVAKLSSASLTIDEIETRFESLWQRDMIDKELDALSEIVDKGNWPTRVGQQISMLFQLRKMEESAAELLLLRDNLKLNLLRDGTSLLESIANSSGPDFKSQKLEILTKDFLKDEKVFSKWTQEQLQCLKAVNRSGKLLTWVTENISNRQELKVFVDLATISAGESDLEVGRILSFQAAMNGYGALIFDLKNRCNLDLLLRACAKVFVELAKDKNLSQALVDSNRQIEWIKEISDRHGSVESSSLNLVELIADSGVIFISTKTPTRSSRAPALEDMIYLESKIAHEQGMDQTLAYSQLDELRSKLMLITVGQESKKAVDKFVSSLASVESVAKLLERLHLAGCHLFTSCVIKCYLEDGKNVSLTLDLGLQTLVRFGPDLEKNLSELTTRLDMCFKEWTAYVDQMRETHSCLNYYTTDQLVRLSAGLGESACMNEALSTEAAMLLQYTCPKMSSDEMKMCVQNLRSPRDLPESVVEVSDDDSMDTDGNDSHCEVSKELAEDYGYDHALAKRCVRFFASKGGKLDVEECAEWCEKYQDEAEIADCTLSNEDMSSDEEGETKETIISVWERFMSDMSSFTAGCFISLDRLAALLQEAMERFGCSPHRRFPSYLQEGKPNLIMCPDPDSHRTALAIYHHDPEKPLPSLSEVLICQPETSTEQVELICRRAFADLTGKIFVVLNAHQLNFDVGMQIEELFTSAKIANESYRLVFVSGKEVNEHSYITTAFDKHAASTPRPLDHDILASYLKRHLKINKAGALAALDPEGCPFRLVVSECAGNGKSLYINRVAKRHSPGSCNVLQIHEEDSDCQAIISTWMSSSQDCRKDNRPRIFHLDLASRAAEKDDLLFSLCVLRGLVDSKGSKLWMCDEADLYMVEMRFNPRNERKTKIDTLVRLLPHLKCESPRNTLEIMKERACGSQEVVEADGALCQLVDFASYESEAFQRPYQYLSLYAKSDPLLEHFVYNAPMRIDYTANCLETLLEHCPVQNPTWTELQHFSSFLDYQLRTTEKSVFCNSGVMSEDLPGLKTFMVRFLVQMSRDFATRSVEVSDESHGDGFSKPAIQDRRRWEKSPHPYVFFNEDGHTLSFFGLHMRGTDLYAEGHAEVLERNVMSPALYQGLVRQGVVFNKHFDSMRREEKIKDLCLVLGVQPFDPDPSYELTHDNVLKMLAVQMRFRSAIPVVIMGETGSGKTRLVKFMCSLQKGKRSGVNMLILKTHGGISSKDISKKVWEAVRLATENKRRGIPQTVLFFDEANTTNAIGVIKNVMCDRLIDGQKIPTDIGLQFVAAVNPYREHSAEMIEKLEKAGLGYHIKAEDTTDRIGRIPLRRLVYRVKEIPESLFPLIWDFGTLNDATERRYISQMINYRISRDLAFIANEPNGAERLLLDCLCESQRFMRKQPDECSFVSLRDVERCLDVLAWFHKMSNHLYGKLQLADKPASEFTITLVLALGVAYLVRLDQREPYSRRLGMLFRGFFHLQGPNSIIEIVNACQDVFVDELKLENNIAKNDALKENVWIMAVSIELKIPLFLVGKPGSSKSLAKTVVADVMQGQQSYSNLFRHFKEIHMVSFQCSPLATAAGIHNTFVQCQKFQEKRNLDTFASVVVLDEVGLAEDSKKMPLKALHPLLENGCIDDNDDFKRHMKVAFVGISNWALDPAKMNRGILVSRGVPTRDDLIKSAQGICANDESIRGKMSTAIRQLTEGYQAVHGKQEREYFGLRDFYSVVKMVFAAAKETKEEPSKLDLQRAVQRNFGGYFGDFDPAEEFLKAINSPLSAEDKLSSGDLILDAIGRDKTETRYILLLTKNTAALRILQEQKLLDSSRTLIIFGSSFPHDQEYTQICSNINRIKIAMEVGQTVVLCNLSNLYESLYDALNQNYATYGGKRYVDLGLGTHRVKCRVHENFRLIVVAEDKEVYEKFPIPLINRLEKHYLGMETMMEARHEAVIAELKGWADLFSQVKVDVHGAHRDLKFTPADVFIGYHDDVVASLVLRCSDQVAATPEDEAQYQDRLIAQVKEALLMCAAPDAVSRLSETSLPQEEKEFLFETYHVKQKHDYLSSYLKSLPQDQRLIQVTTSSRLLTVSGKNQLAREMDMKEDSIMVVSLVQFHTEEQFRRKVDDFLNSGREMLLVQSEVSLGERQNLVECARYNVQDILNKHDGSSKRIVFVLHVPRVAGGCFDGLSVHPWVSCHVDELRNTEDHRLDVCQLRERTVHEVLLGNLVNMQRLIFECLPKAASISGEGEAGTRVQKRVESLIRMTESEEEKDGKFFEVVENLVVASIENAIEVVPCPEKWLVKLAISSEFLREGNTFQKSIWLHLADIVSPILADIVTFCDLDSGLNLLNDPQAPWISDAFLDLLPLPSRDDMRSSSQHGGKVAFESKFPHSRFLIFTIDSLRSQVEGEQCLLLTLMGKNHGAFGKALAFWDNAGFKAIQFYIHDFVHVKLSNFTGISDQVTDFLCEELFKLSRVETEQRIEATVQDGLPGEKMDVDKDEEVSDTLSPIDIHNAFEKHSSRLNFLASLCALMPDLPNHLPEDSNSFESDFRGFLAVLKQHEPDTDALDCPVNRSQWVQRVKRLESLHFKLRGLRLPESESAKQVMERIDDMMRRLTVVKMYLKHVSVEERENDPAATLIIRRIKGLNLKMKNNDLKSAAAFAKLIAFLEALNDEVSRIHFAGHGDTCILCREDLKNPVKLGCDHWGCRDCLEEHIAASDASHDEWACPVDECEASYKKTMRLRQNKKTLNTNEKHKAFKSRLNAFFLDIIQTVVFRGTTPEKEVIETLLSFVVTSKMPKSKVPRTKQMSPFAGHCIDSTPIIRSFMLQVLLLGENHESARESLSQFLQNERRFVRSSKSHLELYLLIVFCLEDHFLKGDIDQSLSEGRLTVPEDVAYRHLKETCSAPRRFQEDLDHLSDVAKVRLGLATTAAVLRDILDRGGDPTKQQGQFLEAVLGLVATSARAESLKRYLVRILVHCHRRDVVSEWRAREVFLDLMPASLVECNTDERVDPFLVLGPHYKRIRDSMRRALVSGEADDLVTLLRNEVHFEVNLALAIHFIVVLNGRKLDDKFRAITGAIKTAFSGLNAYVKSQMTDGDENTSLEPTFHPYNRREQAILSVVFHLWSVLSCGRGLFALGSLRQIVDDPRETPFLPTMPQDETLEVAGAIQDQVTRWFVCERGHPYGIGNCGQPKVSSVCPDCKAPIGGTEYAFAGTGLNVQQVPHHRLTDKTQTGHILGQALRGTRVVAERELSGLEVALTRFVLHSCMAVTCLKGVDQVGSVIIPQIPRDQVPQFLMGHLSANLEDVAAQLGRSEDDAQVLLHKVIDRISRDATGGTGDFATKRGREQWEKAFSTRILKPEIEHLPATVARLDEIVTQDQSAAESALLAILIEKADDDAKDVFENPLFWRPRVAIGLANVATKVGKRRLKERCPNFNMMVENKQRLAMVSRIVQLVRLQEALIRRFDKRLETSLLDNVTIADFLTNQDWKLNEDIRDLVQAFLDAFNHSRTDLFAWGILGAKARSFCGNKEISLASPASILFMSTNHPSGYPFFSLLQFLIEGHNAAVSRFCEAENLEKPEQVPPTELSEDHLVRYDEKEMHLLLLANSRYQLDVESGAETRWGLNLDGIERSVIDRFLAGRPLIDVEKSPKFTFQHETDKRPSDLKSVMEQETLSVSFKHQLGADLKKPVEVCDLLDAMKTTRLYLVNTGGGNSDDLVLPIMTEVLRQKLMISTAAKKTLAKVKLSQVDDLVSWLRLTRARLLVRNRQDPFTHLADELRKPLGPEARSALDPLLRASADPAEVLAALHGFVEEHLLYHSAGAGEEEAAAEMAGRELRGYLCYHLTEQGREELAVRLGQSLPEAVEVGQAADLFVALAKKTF